MEFKRIDTKVSAQKNAANEKYPTDLQLYLDPPTDLIDIEEFQKFAVERVKFLRILETVTARNSKDQPFKAQVIEEMTKQECKLFLPIVKGHGDQETRRKDYLSHYILRLCYCRSEEYRRWFLARELEFFKLKFNNTERKEDIILFMQKSNLNYNPILDSEKKQLMSDLINSTSKNILFDTCSFYKVHFGQVLDLIRGRRVFVKDGFAYVPHHDLVSILSSIFRTSLSHALSVCSANLPGLEGDERLARILKGLHTSYTGSDFVVGKDVKQIPYTAIDGLSKKSFPPCMRAMHDTFKTTHHLRHQARLQFGLFLKGIGVSFEDSLRFWREGFTQKAEIDHDKFEKQYAYGIRHSYGKEGKRANYTPHSCIKIISTSVGAGDNHGCPFKHYDAPNLRQKLSAFGLSVRDVGDVAELAAQGHYQLACTKYFEITHGAQNSVGVNHPNQYFEESQSVITGKVAGDKRNGNVPKYITKPQQRQSSRAADEWGDETLNLDLTAIISEADKTTPEPMCVDS